MCLFKSDLCLVIKPLNSLYFSSLIPDFYFHSYEMQIEKSLQRKGLGKFMMSALEHCAKAWEMEKIVLTVLKNNPEGKSFFTSIGFEVDDSSPSLYENKEYEILSKCF